MRRSILLILPQLAVLTLSAGAHARPESALCRRADAYLQTRQGSVGFAVFDRTAGRRHVCRPAHREITASIVKVDILAALLARHPRLSGYQRSLAERMIRFSDNAAASALWRAIGTGPGLTRFNRRVGLVATRPSPTTDWGATLTTAGDQCRLLEWLARRPVTREHRYVLRLMAHVTPAQAWGVSAALPSRVGVALKNGWVPRSDGWHVNSIGRVRGRGHDYVIAVLTGHDPSFAYGRATIEHLSRLAWRHTARTPPST